MCMQIANQQPPRDFWFKGNATGVKLQRIVASDGPTSQMTSYSWRVGRFANFILSRSPPSRPAIELLYSRDIKCARAKIGRERNATTFDTAFFM
ncbi:unnamed protein product, partial [Iphiclides podalirius]